MTKAKNSGIHLSSKDAEIVMGMLARGDRKHDIAAWFGVNQGRIKGVEDGDFGSVPIAPATQLPPKGPPGLKGRRIKADVDSALALLALESSPNAKAALKLLSKGAVQFDAHER